MSSARTTTKFIGLSAAATASRSVSNSTASEFMERHLNLWRQPNEWRTVPPMAGSLAAGPPAAEVFEQRLVELQAGVERDVIDAGLKALLAEEGAEGLDLALVVAAVAAGIDDDLLLRLGVLELDHALIGKVDFGLVENVEQDDVVAAVPHAAEGLEYRPRLLEQVREEHDQALVAEHRGQLRDALGDVGFPRRLEVGQVGQDVTQLRPLALGRNYVAELLVERNHAHGVLLIDHQVAQRGRQADRVVELGQLLPVREAHRLTEVHHQVAGDVRLGLELLDVVLVGLGEHQPVDVLGVIALRVPPVLGEFDRESMERRRMQPLQKPFHHKLRAQIQPLDLVDDFRLEIFFDAGHAGLRWFFKLQLEHAARIVADDLLKTLWIRL